MIPKTQAYYYRRVKVQGTIDDIPNLVSKYRIKRIIIAIPTLSANRLKEINDICNSTGIELLKCLVSNRYYQEI